MKDLLRKGSIVIMLGTGGVGKTTVAAALGIAGAQAYLETALITVDPAPRLRDALGLERLGGKPARLTQRHLRSAGLRADLKLSALMLDVKGVWDAMVERFVSDPQARKRILQNPFYRNLSAEFAGSESFAALQELYELHQAGRFDLEVVDTPPAAYAFDFLEAPARFVRLFDLPGARWLFTPSLSASRIAMRIASNAARFVVRELERFAGRGVLSTIADFFAAAAESLDAVVDRLHKTQALMRSPAVRFVMVTTAEEDRLRQASDLIAEMKKRELNLSAIVINRFLDERTWRETAEGTSALDYLGEIARLQSNSSSDAAPAHVSTPLVDYLACYRERTLGAIDRIGAFARDLPAGIRLAFAPEMGDGVPDLRALAQVAEYIGRGAEFLHLIENAADYARRAETVAN